MKTRTFILPTCYACALVNDDYSGLEDQDITDLENFITEHQKEGRYFSCAQVSEESDFKHGHDMNRNQGADVSEFTFNVSKIKPNLETEKRNSTINFMYFISNYPDRFIYKIWQGSMADHLHGKFSNYCERRGRSDAGFLAWFYDLDHRNQKLLLQWVNANYVSFKEYKALQS